MGEAYRWVQGLQVIPIREETIKGLPSCKSPSDSNLAKCEAVKRNPELIEYLLASCTAMSQQSLPTCHTLCHLTSVVLTACFLAPTAFSRTMTLSHWYHKQSVIPSCSPHLRTLYTQLCHEVHLGFSIASHLYAYIVLHVRSD